MLKGLKGILEKGLQIAAPFIGNAILPGAGGAMLGSGIASLLTGNKPQDALLAGGASYLGSKMGMFGNNPLAQTTQGKNFTAVRPPLFGSGAADNLAATTGGGKKGNFLMDLTKKAFEERGDRPSFGMQALATGLPAYISYLAAKEDAKKEGPQDPSKYMSAVDTMYGGQFERPPEERRIQNLNPTYKAAGGMMGQQPVNGLKSMEQPVQYSAMTGQGIMGMAKGGDVFPRKTGQINGPGTKTSDSIPAMLSDGEFVQRTDAVNGAGVMMGAKNAQQAREKGADFMYALQDKLAKMGQRVA
jgi:hypothetical protein